MRPHYRDVDVILSINTNLPGTFLTADPEKRFCKKALSRVQTTIKKYILVLKVKIGKMEDHHTGNP